MPEPQGLSVCVAAVQAAPVAFDLEESMRKLEKLVEGAVEKGAQLIVFPEAFLSAYPRHLAFEIGSRSNESRQWYAKYVKSSVKIPSEAFHDDWLPNVDSESCREYWAFCRLSRIAQKHQIYCSVGIVELSNIGSTLWCTNLIFGPTGRLLSRHRKLQPTGAERIVWAQGEATNHSKRDSNSTNEQQDPISDNLPVVQTAIGRLGGLICWENFMPLARYILYQKGVEIYIAPTADGRHTWLPSMQHIAQEGRCFVISANQHHNVSDFPPDYPPTRQIPSGTSVETDDAENILLSKGGSCIIDPLGTVLAGPLWNKEGIIYATINLDSLIEAKLDFDVVGHYSREAILIGLLQK